MTNTNDISTESRYARAAAESWLRKLIKDTRTGSYGLVHDLVETGDGFKLLARFQGEAESRQIALDHSSDGHFLSPDDVRAFYRPLSAAERAGLTGKKH